MPDEMSDETVNRSCSMVEAPVFRPTAEEFYNFAEYVRKIAPVAQKVGLCKICPPKDWLPPCLIDEELHFSAYVQQIGKIVDAKHVRKLPRRRLNTQEKPFTVLSFGEMADSFKRNCFRMPVDKVPDKQIIDEFWNLLGRSCTSADAVCVYQSRNLDGVSGFPTVESKNLSNDDMAYVKSTWNLNNVGQSSVLKHLTGKIPMKVPRSSTGMCFSYVPWQTSEHWSYNISYLHWGEKQTWYSVPSSAFDSLNEFASDCASKDTGLRSGGCNESERMINPEMLLSNGIPVTSVMQEPCEFVLTFPRSHFARVSHGFHLSESLDYCPDSWLLEGRDFSKRQQSLAKPCLFSYDELLFKILRNVDTLSMSLVEILYEILSAAAEDEFKETEKLAALGVTRRQQEIFELVPPGDRKCHICLKICFLSAVTCRCDEKKLVCLHHSDDLCHCPPSERCIHFRYPTSAVESKLERLRDRMRSYESWVQKVNEALAASDDKKLDVSQVKQLKAEAVQLYPHCHLVNRLEEVIAESKKFTSFARKSILTIESKRRPGSDSASSKLTMEELEKFFDAVKRLPVKLALTDRVAAVLDKAASFQAKLSDVISGSIPNCVTLEELVTSSQEMSVCFPETARLQQLLEQRKWLDTVDRRLTDSNRVTVEAIGKLIEDGVAIHPHPSCEKMLTQLQQLQSNCNKLEERAGHILQMKPSSSLSAVESLLDEASRVPVHLPAVIELKQWAGKANAWLTSVENILNGQCSPYLIEVEKCLEDGHSIPLQLEKVSELESLINKADEWIDRTAKAFLKKNSVYSLYEILCPRTDIGTPQSYKIRRKKIGDGKPMTSSSSSTLPVHWMLPDIDVNFPDPATVASTFKMAECKEVDDILCLRNANLKKLSLSSERQSLAKYCICRQGKTPNMMQCELCKEIFHSACVTLPKSIQCKPTKASSSSPSSDLKFFCPMCMRSRRPRLDTIVGLLLDLGKFPVRLAEGEALQSLAEHAFSWQDRARRLLSTDELTRVLARLTVLNQQMAENAAKLKTEKIIRSELLKVGKHGNDYMNCYSAFSLTSALGAVIPRPSFACDFEAMSVPVNEVEIEMQTTGLGRMPSEHAYSSASKHALIGHHSKSFGAGEPIVELSDPLLEEVEQLIIEGDLLEVSLEETHLLWKIMRACRPDITLYQGNLIENSQDIAVEVSEEILDRGTKRKRKSSHNTKVDENFDDEPVAKQPKLKVKKEKKVHLGQEKMLERSGKEKNSLKPKFKQKRDKIQVVGNVEGGPSGAVAKTAEDCEVEKCLRPLGNAVKWVQCDRCEKWYHYFCLGLTKRDISEHDEFVCYRCNPKTSSYTTTPPPGGVAAVHQGGLMQQVGPT